jgi:hypothetical protein
MHSVETLKCRICINQFIMATIKCCGALSCIPIPYKPINKHATSICFPTDVATSVINCNGRSYSDNLHSSVVLETISESAREKPWVNSKNVEAVNRYL